MSARARLIGAFIGYLGPFTTMWAGELDRHAKPFVDGSLLAIRTTIDLTFFEQCGQSWAK
jgi:hypothetical protein